jgi:hypothetical protein
MQLAFNLFDFDVETKEISKPEASLERSAPMVLDRRKIWGEGGFLSTIEDDQTSIHTTVTSFENPTIERLENALNMTPLIENGYWAEDGSFYAYTLIKPVTGQRQFGKRGTFLRDATLYLIQDSALKVLDELYRDLGSWSPRWAYWLFCYRLRKADDCEDPYELLKAFTEAMSFDEPLDPARKGDTLRTVTKRLRLRQRRAAARDAVGVDEADEDFDEFDDETVLKTA